MKAVRRKKPSPRRSSDSHLVPLSCPDCFGVLSIEREGTHQHQLFRCQVDHRYSLRSMIKAKEAQLERTLWSACLLLLQMVTAHELLDKELKQAKSRERALLRRRLNEVRKQCLAIRAMIEASHALE